MRIPKLRRGFLLLEAIPALLLLAAVALLASRLLWLQADLIRRSRVHSRGVATFPAVRECWRQSSSRAALAVHSEPDGLEILEFPDSTWLPDTIVEDRHSWCLWRRRDTVAADGVCWWTVEYKVPGMPEWRWYSRILCDRHPREEEAAP